MDHAIRGVNLGGWLVLERWMTPSLFAGNEAPDEYGYCQQATQRQRAKLRSFRDQFITYKDFQWLAHRGINAVRIPVGYWAFGDEPPYEPTIDYLDQAFAWAEKTGIRILVSLHGAPGSQNGEMHSGRQGETAWHTDKANIGRTLDVVRRLAERYKGSKHLLGISLLNEPSTAIPKTTLVRYYRKAYHIIRTACGNDVWVVFSDGFKPKRWNLVLRQPFYQNTYIDTHQYQIFTPADKAMPADGHLRRTVSDVPLELLRMRRHHPVIVGEWSAALDPQSMDGLDDRQKQTAYRAYCQAQLQAYGQTRTDGWFYWSYKTETGDPWSFRDCCDKGWFKPFL